MIKRFLIWALVFWFVLTGTAFAWKDSANLWMYNSSGELVPQKTGVTINVGVSVDFSTLGDIGIGTAAVSGAQLTLPQENDAVTPTLAFGDGDTGFYESADDTIEVSISGSRRWSASSSGIFNTSARCPFVLFSEQGSATNPVFSLYGDLDTGVGSSGDDILSLIAGGVEGIRVTEAAGAITTQMTGTTNIPGAVLGSMVFPEDSGVIEAFDMPISLASADGVKHGYAFRLDNNSIMEIAMLSDGAGGADTPTVLFPQGYDRHIDIQAGNATVGSTAPTATTIGHARGLGFDADAELAFFNWEVPYDWDGVSDMEIEVIYMTTDGDAVADGETIKLDINYYVTLPSAAVDDGTPVEITNTYTASGNQTDKEMFEQEIVIDFDQADQPLHKGDTVNMQFNRDIGVDTYSGAVIVLRWEVKYVATGLAYQ